MTTARVPTLPRLREELRLLPAAPNADGSPAWTIQDPVANRFYRVGWLDFELLVRWELGTPEAIVAAVGAETLLAPEPADVVALTRFLSQHSLLQLPSSAVVDRLREHVRAASPTPLRWLLRNYLFFRVPLVRPQRVLDALCARLGWLFTRRTASAVAIATLAGLFLAARQWDAFASTFVDQLSWSGLASYALALAFAKTVHELGHALTATRHGVRVAHMGVAFVVMVPMLYTDTGESWKLVRSRQRLAIASAGIVAELALAGLATLAWSLAPDGAARSAFFFLATASWLVTLAINASPFMRFDGYFIAMDALDLPNLHERSGALARAWLRRTLLGWDEPAPERLSRRRETLLVAFALATWIYRVTVFAAIALVVYHAFFKLLGIVLFAVEVAWFIARPIATELRVWIARRGEVRVDRRRAGIAFAAVALAVALVPWSGGIHASGWVHAARQQVLYAPLAGKVRALPTAGRIADGQSLFVLESDDLALSGARAERLVDARARELVGLAGLPNGEDRRAQVQGELERFDAEARMYRGESDRLAIAAPFAGVLADVDPQLARGVWVQPRRPLAIAIDPSAWVVDAYVAEDDVARVRVGQGARVRVDADGPRLVRGRVVEVDGSRTQSLPHEMLSAQRGGPIVTLPAKEGRAEQASPRDALYRVRIALDEAPTAVRMAIGRVAIDGERRAWLPQVVERIAAVVVRESGF